MKRRLFCCRSSADASYSLPNFFKIWTKRQKTASTCILSMTYRDGRFYLTWYHSNFTASVLPRWQIRTLMGLISSWGNGQEPAPPTLTDFSVPLRGQFRRLSQLLRINQQLSGCSGNPTTPHQGVVIIIIILNEFVKGKIMKVEEQNLSAPQPTVSKGSKPHSVKVLSLLSIPLKFFMRTSPRR